MEAQVAFTSLAERLPDVRLGNEDFERGDNLVLRGLRSLPVRF